MTMAYPRNRIGRDPGKAFNATTGSQPRTPLTTPDAANRSKEGPAQATLNSAGGRAVPPTAFNTVSGSISRTPVHESAATKRANTSREPVVQAPVRGVGEVDSDDYDLTPMNAGQRMPVARQIGSAREANGSRAPIANAPTGRPRNPIPPAMNPLMAVRKGAR